MSLDQILPLRKHNEIHMIKSSRSRVISSEKR